MPSLKVPDVGFKLSEFPDLDGRKPPKVPQAIEFVMPSQAALHSLFEEATKASVFVTLDKKPVGHAMM